MDVEVEWGYEPARAALAYDGHLEVYDGRLAQLQALGGDHGTRITGPSAWRSVGGEGETEPEGPERPNKQAGMESRQAGCAVPIALHRRFALAAGVALSCPG